MINITFNAKYFFCIIRYLVPKFLMKINAIVTEDLETCNMSENSQLDSEYNWIVRTCTNAFNVYLTMLHFTLYDNTVNMQPNITRK